MKKVIIALGLVISFARCSIIDDSDITDPNADLKLQYVFISQTTQDGTKDLGIGTSQFDNVGRIASITWDVDKSDFTFRTGIRTSAISGRQNTFSSDAPPGLSLGPPIKTFFETWDSQGRIIRMHNKFGVDFIFEVYTFQYDVQGRLSKMSTIYGSDTNPCFDDIPVSCGDQVIIMNDSIVYLSGGNKIDYIKRRVINGTVELFQEAIYVGYGNKSQSSNNISEYNVGAIALKRF